MPVVVKYPVIPSFHHWRFPHGQLPPLWRDLRINDFSMARPIIDGPSAARDRDISCRLSGYMDALESAHLVPASERLWFASNQMDKYCRMPLRVSCIDDDNNMLVLRKDLHHLFDNRRFTLVPKRFSTDSSRPVELVVHVLLPAGSPQLQGLYHNRTPQPIRGLSVECLFARFAWSLFADEHIRFFGSGLDYAVRLWDDSKGESRTQTMTGMDIRLVAKLFASTSRSHSRSISPKKRSLSTQARDDVYGDWSNGEPNYRDVDELPRGRRRKRSLDSLTVDAGQVPSLSSSFNSRRDSQPLTPRESELDAAMSRKPAGDTACDAAERERPEKRLCVDEELLARETLDA